MVEYCREHGIEHAVCGKVVVALDDDDRQPARRAGATLRAQRRAHRDDRARAAPRARTARRRRRRAARARHRHRRLRRRCAARSRPRSRSAGATIHLEREVLVGHETASGLVVETTRRADRGAARRHLRRTSRRPGRGGGQRARRQRRHAGDRVPGRVPLSWCRRGRISCAASSTRCPIRSSRFSACTSRAASTATCTSGPNAVLALRARGLQVAQLRRAAPPRHVRVLRLPEVRARTTGASASTRWRGRSAGAGSRPRCGGSCPRSSAPISSRRPPACARRRSAPTASSSTTSRSTPSAARCTCSTRRRRRRPRRSRSAR